MTKYEKILSNVFTNNILDYKKLKECIELYPKFSEKLLKDCIPKETMYEHMVSSTKDKGNETAQTFRLVIETKNSKGQPKIIKSANREVTYSEIDSKISEFSKIYPSLGYNLKIVQHYYYQTCRKALI